MTCISPGAKPRRRHWPKRSEDDAVGYRRGLQDAINVTSMTWVALQNRTVKDISEMYKIALIEALAGILKRAQLAGGRAEGEAGE